MLRSLKLHKIIEDRMLLWDAMQAGNTMIELLRTLPAVKRAELGDTVNIKPFDVEALALRIGNEQSVPPPPNFASRSDRLRIESDGSNRASYAPVSNGMTTLSGLRRRSAAAARAATSTHRIFVVPPRPRCPVTGDCIEPDTSSPITTGPGSTGTFPQATSAAL